MTNANRLNELIEGSGLKKGYIAAKLGISRTALWNKINGKSAFNQYEIVRLCDVLEIRGSDAKEEIFFTVNVE